jgi:hypothetical protein
MNQFALARTLFGGNRSALLVHSDSLQIAARRPVDGVDHLAGVVTRWIKGRQEALEVAIKETFPAEFATATDTKPIQSNSTGAKNRQIANKNAQK